MGFIRKEKFSLHHTNVGQFHSSQWSKSGKFSFSFSIFILHVSGSTTLGYVIYRVLLASLMVAGIIAHIIKYSETNPGHKWLIYMTNQVWMHILGVYKVMMFKFYRESRFLHFTIYSML